MLHQNISKSGNLKRTNKVKPRENDHWNLHNYSSDRNDIIIEWVIYTGCPQMQPKINLLNIWRNAYYLAAFITRIVDIFMSDFFYFHLKTFLLGFNDRLFLFLTSKVARSCYILAISYFFFSVTSKYIQIWKLYKEKQG